MTSETRPAFTELRQAFIEPQILPHFDLKHHIRIETDTSSYIIIAILSKFTSDDLG